MKSLNRLFVLLCLVGGIAVGQEPETLPSLKGDRAPGNFDEMWSAFDPRAEPLEVEVLHEWEEQETVLRVVRFRIGVFKGTKAMLAAIYGYPKAAAIAGDKVPGLLQIHGGGQSAHAQACLSNAKRGYATLSIAWAGRISAPGYQVGPREVQLFWDAAAGSPHYKVTTDWGAVDGYHAPGRNAGNQFPSAKPADWTLDDVESPRNSGWFLCALAARRALTFLEQQPEVDPQRLGVYGHSMGGKLTVMTAFDPRVRAAAPSCGGISDRDNQSTLFQATLGDDVSLARIDCPIVFLSPSNDFHGRLGDLPRALREIQSDEWRVTCSPHHNHQDTPEYEVATLLWFDQQLRGTFEFPQTPATKLHLRTPDGVPSFEVRPDSSMPIAGVDIYYTQHGGLNESPRDHEQTISRFWHHADAVEEAGVWSASLPLSTIEQPLWVFANVKYQLAEPVAGAGYYYGTFEANAVNLSSVLTKVSPEELHSSSVRATRQPTLVIEDFQGHWEREWFNYRPGEWARSTHKLRDESYHAPANSSLSFEVQAEEPNRIVVLLDQYAAVVELDGDSSWERVMLQPGDFVNHAGELLKDWSGLRHFRLSPQERLTPGRGQTGEPRIVGSAWQGAPPRFRDLRWEVEPSVVP